MAKYIQETKSGRYAVVFPESIKSPRRLGVYDTLDEARLARDQFLENNDEPVDQGNNLYPLARGVGNVVVGLYDLHCPYQDGAAIKAAKSIIDQVRPDAIVFGGDAVDFFGLSKFLKDDSRATTIQDELDVWHETARGLLDGTDATVFFVVGNHELRLYRYLCANPELASLDVLRLESLLRLDEIGAQICRGVTYLNNRLVFIHGRYYSKIAGSAVRREMDARAYQQSIIQGHGHKCGRYDKPGPLFNVVGVEAGCLCQDSWYSDDVYWQRGAVVVTIDGGQFEIENVHFGAGVFRGKRIA